MDPKSGNPPESGSLLYTKLICDYVLSAELPIFVLEGCFCKLFLFLLGNRYGSY